MIMIIPPSEKLNNNLQERWNLDVISLKFCDIFAHMDINDVFSRPDKIRGVIIIRNLKSGKAYLKTTEDAVKSFSDERFHLDLSMHECKELQEEYTALGLELFTIELDTEAGPDDDLQTLLEKRENEYRNNGVTLYSDPLR